MSKKPKKNKIKEKSVFILVGMPGSGKSTLAKKIAEKLGAKYLSSDEIREELFNSTRHGVHEKKIGDGLREKAHKVLYSRALKFLTKKEKIIIDATHLDPKKRALAIKILSEIVNKNEMCFIVISTPAEIIEQRVKEKINEFANNIETAHEGWKRVTSYFLQDFKNGKLSWPTKSENIDLFDHKELAYELAK